MADFLTTLQKFESGGRNIPNTTQGTSSGQAQGFNQITTGTWKEFGGLAYAPTPLQATQEQQNAIAAKIPLQRWAPETLAYLRNQGFTLNPKATLAENIAANHGTLGVAAPPHTTSTRGVLAAPVADSTIATPVAAAPAAAPAAADQPWWSKFVNPPVDAQGKPVEGAKSPLEQAVATVTGGPSEKTAEAMKAAAPQRSSLEMGSPGARNVSPGLAPGAAQQVWGQTLNSFMQPLSWSSAPPGSGMGPVAGYQGYHPAGAAPAAPGTSLASVPYSALDPNFGAGFQFGG